MGEKMSSNAKTGIARLRRLTKKQRNALFAGIVVIVLLVLYAGGVAHYSSHFFPHTQVDGIEVGGQEFSSLAQQAADRGTAYKLKISGSGIKLTVKGSDIDLECDGTTYSQAAASHVNAWVWPLMMLDQQSYEIGTPVSYDSDKLASTVETAVESANESKTQPVSAKLVWDSSSKQFAITGEKKGTALDEEAVVKAADSAVQHLETKVKIGKSLRQKPSMTSTDETLVSERDQANAIVGNTITLTKSGNTVTTLGSSTIANWVSLGSDNKVSVYEDGITEWANSYTVEYSSVGGTRKYTRPDGKKFTVKGGTYGWNVDSSKLAKSVTKAVKSGEETSIEIPMSQEAANFNPGHQDWGSRYVDVDLKKQNAHFYDENGNLIWSSKIVSGMNTKEHRTPEGVYTINSHMARNQTLKGLDKNGDGKPDYTSKVKYWMPFVDNLVAFHDAPWRSAFGGTYYKSNGSHGCVNLPSKKAKELYSLIKVGDVVVVHK